MRGKDGFDGLEGGWDPLGVRSFCLGVCVVPATGALDEGEGVLDQGMGDNSLFGKVLGDSKVEVAVPLFDEGKEDNP